MLQDALASPEQERMFSKVPLLASEHVFIQGAPLVGGTNGMYFDTDNNLFVAQVYGRAISKINAETGEILEALGFEDSVAFADDLAVASDGTLYWSDSFYFQTIYSRSSVEGGPSFPLLPIGSVPFANPVTLSTDGTRLYYAQCWNPEPVNGVYEINLVTNTTTPVVENIPGCASNAMDFWDEALYTPRPYEGRIVKIDLAANNTVSNVTTGWGGAPNALKFDSRGRLYATNSGIGEVARIDFNNTDTENNREVLAQFPPGYIDNLALDKDDRLFISSTSDGAVVEVLLPSGDFRTVSGGEFSISTSVAYLNNMLFSVHPGALFGFDPITGERKLVVRSIPGGAGSFFEPTSLATWDDDLVLLSFTSGAVEVYDPFAETHKFITFFGGPVDAHPFQGDLLVTDSLNGTVVRASGPDLGNREVIFTSPGVAFLTGDDNNVFLTDLVGQSLYQIIQGGEILNPPGVIASGFVQPEDIVLMPGGKKIILVDGGKETLEEIDLETGEVNTIVTDLGFLPGIPGLEFGFANTVAHDGDGTIYVNGDRTNAIYKFEGSGGTTSAAISSTCCPFQYALLAASVLFFL